MESIILKNMFAEPYETHRRADVFVTSFMVDVVDSGFGRMSAIVVSALCSNSALRRKSDVIKLQMKYNRFLA